MPGVQGQRPEPVDESSEAVSPLGVEGSDRKLENSNGAISLTALDVDNAQALEDPQARQQALTKMMTMAIEGMQECQDQLGSVPDKAIPQLMRAKANYLAIAKNIVESMGKIVVKEINPPQGGKAHKIIEVAKIRSMGSEADLDRAEAEVREEMTGKHTVAVGENGEIGF